MQHYLSHTVLLLLVKLGRTIGRKTVSAPQNLQVDGRRSLRVFTEEKEGAAVKRAGGEQTEE